MSNLKRNGIRRWAPSYLRNRGHLSKAQRRALREQWPDYGIELRHGQTLSLNELFPEHEKIHLELGFGQGEVLLQRAAANPHQGFLGIEAHRPAIATVLRQLESTPLANIKLIRGDALLMLHDHLIADRLFADISILFPDPWPSDYNRRILRESTLPLFAQFLSPLGTIRFASDVSDYVDSIRELAVQWQLTVPPRGWRKQTRYEQKGLREGRPSTELWLSRAQPESGRFRM